MQPTIECERCGDEDEMTFRVVMRGDDDSEYEAMLCDNCIEQMREFIVHDPADDLPEE